MLDTMRSVEDCNVIRYVSYRTAVKMQVIHRELQSK